MGAGEIIAIIVFGLLLAAAFDFGLKQKGPWGSFWSAGISYGCCGSVAD